MKKPIVYALIDSQNLIMGVQTDVFHKGKRLKLEKASYIKKTSINSSDAHDKVTRHGDTINVAKTRLKVSRQEKIAYES
ncbi:MAG: hypothetical protein WAQ24_02985 [Candidatus Saccharimonadales bacterium]